MMVNKINIEGVCEPRDLENICVGDRDIFSKEFLFSLPQNIIGKDLIEVHVASEIIGYRPIIFKDGPFISVTIEVEFKFLLEEQVQSLLMTFNENMMINHMISGFKYPVEKDNLKVMVIDSYFKLIDGVRVEGFIAYILKEFSKGDFSQEDRLKPREKYRYIDLLQEFP